MQKSDITIRLITEPGVIDILSQPFDLFGRLVPLYDGSSWSYREELWEETTSMCFPPESYNPAESDMHFIGAFDGDECVGLAVMEDAFFRYWYLSDLMVATQYRKRGVAKALLEKALELALEKKYRGIWAVCQDNNLGAARFYLKTGFVIGGTDTMVYKGTNQADKIDIHFYLDAKP